MSRHAATVNETGTTFFALTAPRLITGLWLGCILLWEWSGADLQIMSLLADRHGFELRHDWWLRIVLHDGLHTVSVLCYFALIIAIWQPFGFMRATSRLQRMEMFSGVTAALLAISLIKHFSLTSCPWDLTEFGGMARYVSHWAWGIGDDGPGRCFPSGHASAGFAFLALALPGLLSASAAQREKGRRMFYLMLLFGLVCGVTQVLRGAHYPSHVLWTGLICWTAALVNHLTFRTLHRPFVIPHQGSPDPS